MHVDHSPQVKHALMNPPLKHFGMEGEKLQDYLLQLTKKEVSLLEIASSRLSEGGSDAGASSSHGPGEQLGEAAHHQQHQGPPPNHGHQSASSSTAAAGAPALDKDSVV